jgi:hypothetical protein
MPIRRALVDSEDASTDDAHTRRFATIPIWAPVLLAILIGAVALVISAFEEPYHVDELLQTRSYDQPIGDIIDASIAQQQPPLDPILNATVQRFIGVGDPQQRALSVIFGIASLTVFGMLMLRSRLRTGSAAAVMVIAIAPLLVSVTAYARPYALPLFLILLFLLTTDVWLADRRAWAGLVLFLTAILLPLSKTIEPNLALGLSIGVLLTWKFLAEPKWKGTIWVPVGAATIGIIAIGVPVVIRLQSDLARYTISGVVHLAGLSRWLTDIPQALEESFAPWPIALALAIGAIISPTSRRLLTRTWWFWVLLLLPIAFATLFLLRTPESQPFYTRYTFTWWPPFAMMVGAIVATTIEAHESMRRAWRGVVVVAVAVLFIGLGHSLQADLRSDVRYNFAALGAEIMKSTSVDTTVVFDPTVPLGSYRTSFAGRWGRYVDADRDIPLTIWIAKKPSRVPEAGPIAVALINYQRNVPGWPIDVVGWERIDAGPFESLYLAPDHLSGRSGTQIALLEFANALGPRHGAAFALASASLAAEDGDIAQACSILSELRDQIGGPSAGQIDKELTKAGEGAAWAQACPER